MRFFMKNNFEKTLLVVKIQLFLQCQLKIIVL